MKLRKYRALDEKESVFLDLKEVGDSIVVYAVDSCGAPVSCGRLITINSDGSIYRHTHINENLGFQLTKDKKVKIDEGGFE